MEKRAQNSLTEERFWSLIEQSNKGENLREVLSLLNDEEIFGYRYWWDYFNAISYKQDLWAVAYVVMGGCSDDGFDYFRFWLVAQGKEVFENAMENADSLCDIFDEIEDGDYPEREDFDYFSIEIIDERHGDDAFYEMEEEYSDLRVKRPEIEFLWGEENEDSIQKVCPNTFKKWWNNDKF